MFNELTLEQVMAELKSLREEFDDFEEKELVAAREERTRNAEQQATLAESIQEIQTRLQVQPLEIAAAMKDMFVTPHDMDAKVALQAEQFKGQVKIQQASLSNYKTLIFTVVSVSVLFVSIISAMAVWQYQTSMDRQDKYDQRLNTHISNQKLHADPNP